MSNQIKNSVLTNVITVIATGVVSTFGFWLNSEFETYKEMKAALPEIKEINEIRKDMELEYKSNKQKVSSELWQLKDQINGLKAQHKKDSVYIYYNYYYVKRWVENGY